MLPWMRSHDIDRRRPAHRHFPDSRPAPPRRGRPPLTALSSLPSQLASTPLQHQAFWDRGSKGYLTPADVFVGFRRLGFGLFLSLLSVPIIVGTFAYW